MKKFKYAMLQKEYTNKNNEKIILVLDRNAVVWIYHEDCNTDFEKLNTFIYILDKEETDIIQSFCEEAEKVMAELQQN